MTPKPPLWKCPRCGHRFVTKNLSHSCVRVRLADHFRGKPRARNETLDRRLETPGDVDDALVALMREAYRVGQKERD